jgi:hypothetical protein
MAGMKRRPHEITIDRLVLPSGTVGTRRVRAVIERELARLIAAQPAEGDVGVPTVRVRVETAGDADAIGAAVAREAHGAVKRGRK